MATGYTMKIEEGQNFEDFVTGCARAFVHPEAELVEEKPDNYHKQELEIAIKELKEVQKITLAQAEVNAKKRYEEELKDWANRIEREKKLKKNYESMLQKVQDWHIPSSKHEKLQEFMIEQIEDSIKHDCDSYWAKQPQPRRQTSKEWLDAKIESANWSVGRHKKGLNDDLENNTHNNNWVRILKESLKED